MPRHQSFDEIQKGAFFRAPCVTLGNEAEWVETVEAGWNDLPALSLNPVPLRYPLLPYGNGRAAECIVDTLVKCFVR